VAVVAEIAVMIVAEAVAIIEEVVITGAVAITAETVAADNSEFDTNCKRSRKNSGSVFHCGPTYGAPKQPA